MAETMRAEPLEPLGDGPPVAYVPGIDGAGVMLFGTEARIVERWRLHRFRYVGTRRVGAALYPALADSIVAALPPEPTILVAESFGGAVALTAALRAPERVRALLLVNTFARFPRRVRIRAGAALMPFVPHGLVALGRRVAAPRVLIRPRRDAAAEEALARMEPGIRSGGFPARMQAIRDLDLRPELGRVTAPCALCASTHDRVVPSPRTMAELARGLPDATLETLDRAGHVVLPLAEEPWPERLEALAQRRPV
ncbi:MAG: alpha/beta fold hydrolase [Planctomycetota bacterium]